MELSNLHIQIYLHTEQYDSIFLGSNDTVIATEIDHNPTQEEVEKLSWLYGNAKVLNDKELSGYYLGPRREMITPWSTNAVEITQKYGY